MIVYKVFYKDYGLKRDELKGALAERRKNLRGRNRREAGLKWAKSIFGPMVKDKHALFVVPDDLSFEKDTQLPVRRQEDI